MEDHEVDASLHFILFTGTPNQLTPTIEAYVQAAVTRAFVQGKLVLVGDTPSGVELEVLRFAGDHPNIAVMSIMDRDTKESENRSSRVLAGEPHVKSRYRYEQYIDRDQNMIDLADSCVFITDGKSKTAKSGFDYAVSIGKDSYLIDFGKKSHTGKVPNITIKARGA